VDAVSEGHVRVGIRPIDHEGLRIGEDGLVVGGGVAGQQAQRAGRDRHAVQLDVGQRVAERPQARPVDAHALLDRVLDPLVRHRPGVLAQQPKDAVAELVGDGVVAAEQDRGDQLDHLPVGQLRADQGGHERDEVVLRVLGAGRDQPVDVVQVGQEPVGQFQLPIRRLRRQEQLEPVLDPLLHELLVRLGHADEARGQLGGRLVRDVRHEIRMFPAFKAVEQVFVQGAEPGVHGRHRAGRERAGDRPAQPRVVGRVDVGHEAGQERAVLAQPVPRLLSEAAGDRERSLGREPPRVPVRAPDVVVAGQHVRAEVLAAEHRPLVPQRPQEVVRRGHVPLARHVEVSRH
jgi:hypothetical protein